jgi:uncharacterized C2H2 Zn-finger protein
MDAQLPAVDVVPAAESESGHRLHCPLCDSVARTRTDLRCHMEVSHRKSQLTTALLERVKEDPEPV